MAKDSDKKDPMAEESDAMDEAEASRPATGSRSTPPSARSGKGLNLFSMYKPNQGKQIRLWSAVGAGLLILGAWGWAVPKLQVSFSGTREWMAAAIGSAVCAVMAAVVWYLVGVNRTAVDFLIATESEMKKVTWSSRKEVWGATKVVIGMTVFMAIGLFVVDVSFTWFFTKIHVLRTPF